MTTGKVTKILRLVLPSLLLAFAACRTRPDRDVSRDARVASTASVEPALLHGLAYRMIGPHRGGRSTAVTGVAGDHRTFYMGAAGGGVWKTTDAGEVWENVSDPYFRAGSVGAIAVAASNASVLYVGTGSACLRNNVSVGIGMYKSVDAGATWQPAGLDDAGQIARVRVDPRDPNLVYVAALGHAFGPNAMRGVFRTRDGGRTWARVLFVNDRTGGADLAMDAHDPRVLYAAMWTGALQPWGLPSGSTDGGVFKTTDGGDHWTKLSGGLPSGSVDRIGVAVSQASPARVWALVDAGAEGGVYRSDDAGKTFKRLNTDRGLTGRSSVPTRTSSPTRGIRDVVYVANTNLYRSRDGGSTFSPIAMPHGDNHDLWIDPQDPRVMIEGNDGGATISVNAAASWSTQLNQPTAEMYRVVTDDQVPYRVYGAQQDQYDALSLPSRTANFGARLSLQHWYTVGGYEGGFVAVDPRNPDVVYAGGPGGMITRFDRATTHLRSINEEAGRSRQYRFAWNAPIFISPLDPDNVYHTSNVVHRSSDGGQTWSVISPDLTRHDKDGQRPEPPGAEVDSYPTISAFQESRRERGVLWAGSDDGLVHLSRDAGATWQDVTPKAMPERATVNAIEPSPHNAARAFLAVYRYKLDDFHPYIYRTDDYGQSWTLLTDGHNGIPADQFVRVVREDPVREGLLYAGTEYGMFVSFDSGGHWQSLQLNLPATPVTDIVVHAGDVVLSTNGRSFWILDDVSPLRELAVQAVNGPHLFGPRDAYRIATSAEEDDQPYVGGACCVSNPRDIYTGARIERHQLGEEPPDGAIVYVALPDAPAEPLTLSVLDADGRPVRRLVDTAHPIPGSAPPHLTAGLNRVAWDLRFDPPEAQIVGLRGPKAAPGAYQLRLTVGGRTQTASFHVLPDPRLHLTQEDYQRQFDLLADIGRAMTTVRHAASAVEARRRTGGGDAAALSAVERQLVPGPGGGRGGRGGAAPPLLTDLTALYDFVGGSEDRPTAAAVQRWNELRRVLDERLASVKTLVPDVPVARE